MDTVPLRPCSNLRIPRNKTGNTVRKKPTLSLLAFWCFTQHARASPGPSHSPFVPAPRRWPPTPPLTMWNPLHFIAGWKLSLVSTSLDDQNDMVQCGNVGSPNRHCSNHNPPTSTTDQRVLLPSHVFLCVQAGNFGRHPVAVPSTSSPKPRSAKCRARRPANRAELINHRSKTARLQRWYPRKSGYNGYNGFTLILELPAGALSGINGFTINLINMPGFIDLELLQRWYARQSCCS